MYFCSGLARCSKCIPVEAVISMRASGRGDAVAKGFVWANGVLVVANRMPAMLQDAMKDGRNMMCRCDEQRPPPAAFIPIYPLRSAESRDAALYKSVLAFP